MSRWEEQLNNHQIHSTLEELSSYIDTNFDDIDETEIIEKRRLLKVFSIIKEILENIDPEIIPFNTLDSFDTQLRHQNCLPQLSSYKQNGNVQHLVNANNHITNTLAQLTQYMILSDNFSVNKDIKPLEKSLDSFSSALIENKTKIKEELDKLEKKFVENDTKVTQLSSSIDQKKNETDSLISQWQQQFSDAQSKRTDAYTNWFDSLKDKSQETLESHFNENQEKINEKENEVYKRLDSIIDDSNKKHERILELYELTAGDSVGSAYLKNANDEQTEANTWRDKSIYFIVGTAIWIFLAYIFNTGVAENGTDLVWGELIMSFSLTAVLLYGAAYSAQQSTKHRNNEKRARWFALEIKAIDPFISSLPESDQQTLKKELSEKLFAQSEHFKDVDKKILDEHAFNIVIKGLTDLFKANK
ncbi:hypothetical protein [Aliarcobacter cryaerophilus]|jgi:hypothetical protein|uniref:Uncharacterized protein n=1 Tax=Arcobacter sp. AZ-2023 TaxID=3074453 RepID=A0AA96IIL4_9BACT|nr:hypothetical protein RMQ68_03750 [Arcobacter sp. AZ-2023]